MSRIIAIDYGKKRTGIAVTDILQLIANGLTTVPTTELMDFLLNYVAKEPVERIIVGHPKQMNNEDSENMKRITPFVNLLKKKLPQHRKRLKQPKPKRMKQRQMPPQLKARLTPQNQMRKRHKRRPIMPKPLPGKRMRRSKS